MNEAKYDEIWERVVYPTIDGILKKSRDIYLSNNDSGQKLLKKLIFQKYEKNRKEIKEWMKDPNGLIDAHKIAAALGYAVLQSEIFQVREGLETSKIYPHELLAWKTAWAVIQSFRIDSAKKDRAKAKENNDADKQLIAEKTIRVFNDEPNFYNCNHGGKHLSHIVKSLRFTRTKKTYDFFLFANLLFMIERYNLEKENLQERIFE